MTSISRPAAQRQPQIPRARPATPQRAECLRNKLLQPVTKAQQALWTAYGSTQGSVGYPFIDFGNKVAVTGPLYLPTMLHGLTWSQVAASSRTRTTRWHKLSTVRPTTSRRRSAKWPANNRRRSAPRRPSQPSNRSC